MACAQAATVRELDCPLHYEIGRNIKKYAVESVAALAQVLDHGFDRPGPDCRDGCQVCLLCASGESRGRRAQLAGALLALGVAALVFARPQWQRRTLGVRGSIGLKPIR